MKNSFWTSGGRAWEQRLTSTILWGNGASRKNIYIIHELLVKEDIVSHRNRGTSFQTTEKRESGECTVLSSQSAQDTLRISSTRDLEDWDDMCQLIN